MEQERAAGVFERCETIREEAKNQALANGETRDEAEKTAHGAAKSAWNGWAEHRLQERHTLASNSKAISDWELIASFDFASLGSAASGRFSFAGFIFPAAVRFSGASFNSYVDFDGSIFHSLADFNGAIFTDYANFKRADFRGGSDFKHAKFCGNAVFKDAKFGCADGQSRIDFQDCFFEGVAEFTGAKFYDNAHFEEARFRVSSTFQAAQFERRANFGRARFTNAGFEKCSFRDAVFADAEFGSASFEDSGFSDGAFFENAHFGEANFERVKFNDADFRNAEFHGEAKFEDAAFDGSAQFSVVKFREDVTFESVNFASRTDFSGSRFLEAASFRIAEFKKFATFKKAHFIGDTSFEAVSGERAFDLTDATFEKVPNFIQAHFEEAPRLDNIEIRRRTIERRWRTYRWLFKAHDRHDVPARWRALRRLAIQSHDDEREHEFFTQEVRSGRFTKDPPLPFAFPRWTLPKWLAWLNYVPFVFWRKKTWAGFSRFWWGFFYERMSNFGRSLLLPFAIWAALILGFAIFYLGQNEEMTARRGPDPDTGLSSALAYVQTAIEAYQSPPSCYPGGLTIDRPYDDQKGGDGFSGLVTKVRNSTDIVSEAFSIAYHNAVVVLDSSGDSMHRAFGCLYGVERYGGDPIEYVPRHVAIASGLQKALSTMMIFLFGLALRNMLKMK